jgi:ferredoxin
MPTVTVAEKHIEVPVGTKLVSAIQALGIEIGHRCGGNARCTTCRVTVVAGEPSDFTRAEFLKLRSSDLLGEVRLSCQIVVTEDVHVEVHKTRQSEGWLDTGPTLADAVTPHPERFPRAELEVEASAG